MLHYVEKPSSFVSTTINCGVYLFTLDLFYYIANIFRAKHNDFLNSGDSLNSQLSNGVNGVSNGDNHTYDCISLEEDVLMPLSQSKNVFVFRSTSDEWWSQIKTAGSAIHANRNYLKVYRKTNPELLSNNNPMGPTIIGDVFIHPSASVDPSAIVSYF
jgi:mannose-1-phosphate guanylyltransferase